MGLDASVCNWAHYIAEYGDEGGYYTGAVIKMLEYLRTLHLTPDWDLENDTCPHRERVGSYGTLHVLRRWLLDTASEFSPAMLTALGVDPQDPDLRFSNLCHHSDCDGIYLPADFDKPLDEMYWGSVPALAREMELVRRLLEIPLDARKADYDMAYVNAAGEEWGGWGAPPVEYERKAGRYVAGNDALDGPRWVWCHFNAFVAAAADHRLPLHFH